MNFNKKNILKKYFLYFVLVFLVISLILVFANDSKIDLFNKYIENKDYAKAEEIIKEIQKESKLDALIAKMILYAYLDSNLDNSKKVLKILERNWFQFL